MLDQVAAEMPLMSISEKPLDSLRSPQRKVLSHLPSRPPVDIEFTDISYVVPHGRKGSKIILRSISGIFKSGQLTAILGPSGAGKSTLLNVLAGYKCPESTGTVLINGEPRDMAHFHKMSCYIMQEDIVRTHISVKEAVTFAADLKLGSELTKEQKQKSIDEVLDLLSLTRAKDTETSRLSGGERKRLSIALELINNPPVIFLDEPTTGLDDLSSSQCISLLKMLAEGGRTIVCSVHTPSAKLFAMFDHVYVVAAGQCAFQGLPKDIVPFLSSIGLECPKHYNPADFVIEVASGEYGDHLEKMVTAVDNGHCGCWSLQQASSTEPVLKNGKSRSIVSDVDYSKLLTNQTQDSGQKYNFKSTSLEQVRILTHRMLLQTWRDRSYLCLQFLMYLFLVFIIGGLYWNMGQDGAKQLYNFGFCYTCIIVFTYLPLLPVLLHFPYEVRILKREYFNRWYSLNAYFLALSIAGLPVQLAVGIFYISSVYWLSNQPLEFVRVCQFILICLLIGFVSESLGLAISSRLDIVNGMFVGPALSVPLMLFAVYGMGAGSSSVPIHMRLVMCLSYLRFGFEGIMYAIYGNNRPMLTCPVEEQYCHFRSPKTLLMETGMENSNIWVSVIALIFYILVFKGFSYLLLRWRLTQNHRFAALNYVGRIIKTHFSVAQNYT
ncbi:ATP-binding cassette subfamily G member 4 [Periplaneta americana]|uniref:ATP-binding cassette subfamily G member 4 n=1 Tax=Periplaneta americana TaxID=6978 RepID=UPI0037E7E796